MEFANKSPLRSGLSSRSGALTVAAVTAVIAAILVFAAINSARNGGSTGSARVLIANQLIPKGSTAQALAEGELFRIARVEDSALVTGAVTDISQIQGEVATRDVYPGQQLSAGAFGAGSGAVATKLAGTDRAMSIPLGDANGLVGDVHSGDRVDVIAGFNVQGRTGSRQAYRYIARDILVLKAPDEGDSGDKHVLVRVGDDLAAKLTFASDNGKVWLVLRPGAGAKDSADRVITASSILFGVKPVQVEGR